MTGHQTLWLIRFRQLIIALCVIALTTLARTPMNASAAHSSSLSSHAGAQVLQVAKGHGSLIPTVTCVDVTSKNQYTVYFGYSNTGSPVSFPTDSKFNRVSPSSYNGGQPTDFSSGTVTNAFSVLVTSPSISWTLSRDTVSASSTSTQCAGSSLPVDPLGLSLILALGVGVVVGVFFVTRTARRRRPL